MTDTIKPDPDTRHGPLEDLHRSLGAKLGPFGGWLMPIEYRGVLSEHRAVRERVGLFDLSHLGKVDVVGASAFDALQGLLTNDLRKVEVGRAQYHHLLNEHGGVEEDLFVYRLSGDRWFLVPNAANKDKVVAAVRSRGAEVVDHDGWCFLGVQGPRSQAVVSELWRSAVELSFRGVRVVDWHGTEVVLARTGYTGERGFELFADAGIAPSSGMRSSRLDGRSTSSPAGSGRATCSAWRWATRSTVRTWARIGPRSRRGWGGRCRSTRVRSWDATRSSASASRGLPSLLRGIATADRRHIPRPTSR